VMAYMGAVDSFASSDGSGIGWFKIFADGFDGTNWGVTRLYAAKGLQTFTIPSCIPPGNYFLRAEIIALHPASTYPGAQVYVECAQINVTGGGSTSPPTVSFPGAYHPTDPGITIDIYYPPVTNYTIPGPPVFTCGGGGGTAQTTTASTPKTTSSVVTTAKVTSTSATSTTSAKATSSSAAPAGTGAAHYAQCGGAGWTGATVCVSPYTCTASGAYYSQCL